MTYVAPSIEVTMLDLGDLMGVIGASAPREDADGPEPWGAKARGTFFMNDFEENIFTVEEVVEESADEFEFHISLN